MISLCYTDEPETIEDDLWAKESMQLSLNKSYRENPFAFTQSWCQMMGDNRYPLTPVVHLDATKQEPENETD